MASRIFCTFSGSTRRRNLRPQPAHTDITPIGLLWQAVYCAIPSLKYPSFDLCRPPKNRP